MQVSISNHNLETGLEEALKHLAGLVIIEPIDDGETKEQIEAINLIIDFLREDDGAREIQELVSVEVCLLQLLNAMDHEHLLETVETICLEKFPPFILFDAENRNLLTRYNLDSYFKNNENIPKALDNLATVCGLDLGVLWTQLKRKADGRVATLLADAHDKIDVLLKRHWAQAEIHARFYLEGPVLKIQIEDKNRVFSSLGERSDGLKQFIALLVFTVRNRSQKPALLIDEAELHLHYDGQADLLQMLEMQQVSSKVIYTTHSVGCLPEDLGKGVRILSVDGPHSRFINWFWGDGNVGFSPVLIGIGAQTLAYFPVRRAVIAEGPSDMLLLPALIREATDRYHVGYQVAPGLAQAGEAQIKLLCNEGRSVVYVVDGDPGGENLEGQLLKAGVSKKDIRKLGGKSEKFRTIEDLINPKHIVTALNLIIERRGLSEERIERSDLEAGEVADSLSKWCEKIGIPPIGKRELAYQLLGLASDDKECQLMSISGKRAVKSLDKWIRAKFSIET